MSYFEKANADVTEANLAGKRELARLISAIMLDADAKMDDPDTYDREYVMEDFMGRLAAVVAPFTSEPFERWRDHMLAYPEMMARDESGLIRPFIAAHVEAEDAAFVTRLAENTERAIREARQVMTWEGVNRHSFKASYSGAVCAVMVERNGYGDRCGLPASHAVHEWRVQ